MPLGPFERKQIQAMRDEITTLRQQLAESQERCAELSVKCSAQQETILQLQDLNEARDLRKQADAVEAFGFKHGSSLTRSGRLILRWTNEYAQCLRAMADK